MSDSCKQYVENELKLLKSRLDDIDNEIRSSKIQLTTLDDNIKKLNDEKDWTEDIFHSVTSVTNNTNETLITLKNSKSEIQQKIEKLSEEKNDVSSKYEKIIEILEEDTAVNVSHETLLEQMNHSIEFINFIEMDRKRISRDIHDGVVQNLTALIHKQEFIYQIADRDINRTKLEINNTISIIKKSINELRNVIYEIRPMSVDDLDFKNALTIVLDKLDRENDKIIYDYAVNMNDDIIFNSTIKVSVLRIINELNSNAIKYSNCTNISINIDLDKENNSIVINFKDNGCGFDFDNTIYDKEKNTGFGIAMLKERVSLLKGTIQYSNNNGSDFLITIPIW